MLEFDPELAAAVASRMGDVALPVIARDDWRALRAMGEAGAAAVNAMLPAHEEVTRTDAYVRVDNGQDVLVRWYTPPGYDSAVSGPAVVYLHGGGMIAVTVDIYDHVVAGYVADTGVPFLAVDYRTAPEFPHPAPVEDSLLGVNWLIEHAADLGVDPNRIAIMGDSGGGGVAAGAAILARDRGIALKRQILIYPMLDDRNTEVDPALASFARGWTYDNNYTGWHALLGDAIGTDDVPATAAPARLSDAHDLAPAYIEVGELDIFRDESIQYARILLLGGVSAELHVHPGCPHGFDLIGPSVPVVRRARADRLRVITSL